MNFDTNLMMLCMMSMELTFNHCVGLRHIDKKCYQSAMSYYADLGVMIIELKNV